jgi:hypothetical protein
MNNIRHATASAEDAPPTLMPDASGGWRKSSRTHYKCPKARSYRLALADNHLHAAGIVVSGGENCGSAGHAIFNPCHGLCLCTNSISGRLRTQQIVRLVREL